MGREARELGPDLDGATLQPNYGFSGALLLV